MVDFPRKKDLLDAQADQAERQAVVSRLLDAQVIPDLTDWEDDFLCGLVDRIESGKRTSGKLLSTREEEILSQIEDKG